MTMGAIYRSPTPNQSGILSRLGIKPLPYDLKTYINLSTILTAGDITSSPPCLLGRAMRPARETQPWIYTI